MQYIASTLGSYCSALPERLVGINNMIDSARITISKEDSTVLISCAGALDLTNSSDLQEGIAQAAETMDSVTVDMCQVIFIDTAVLSYLAYGAKVMLGRGKRLTVVVKAKSQPQRVLETVGFSGLMTIEIVSPAC